MRNANDSGDVLTCGRRDGIAHFFYQVLGADVAGAIGSKEAVLFVHSVFGLDLTRRAVHNVSQDL